MPNGLIKFIFTQCLTYFFAQSENLIFYFMETTNIPVYGNIAVYIKYCAVGLKIDYTLRYFIVKTLTDVLLLLPKPLQYRQHFTFEQARLSIPKTYSEGKEMKAAWIQIHVTKLLILLLTLDLSDHSLFFNIRYNVYLISNSQSIFVTVFTIKRINGEDSEQIYSKQLSV